MDKVLSLVGMAKKAGYAAIGEEPVGAAARAHIARVILLASDAAPASVRRAESFAKLGGSAVFTLKADKAALGQAVGRSNCAMLAVTDAGMAASIAKKLAADAPEQQETLEQLEKKAARVNARRREKRAHEKRLARNATPWAAPAPQRAQSGRKPKHAARSGGAKPTEAAQIARAPRKPAARPQGGKYLVRSSALQHKKKPDGAGETE